MSTGFDGETRTHIKRLLLCGVLLICLLAAVSVAAAKRETSVQLSHDRALISALLKNGVSETVLAQAMQHPAETPEGVAFLDRIGWKDVSALRDVPESRAFFFYILLIVLFAAAIPLLLLFLETRRYFYKRERLYLDAAQTLTRYLDGDGDARLRRDDSGGVYTLLSVADALIMALQSRGEAERRTKDALRDAVSDISHQLKTPLAALRLYNDLTVGAADDSAAVRTFAEKSAVSIDRIEGMIQTLLKVMRLDAGSIRFQKEPCRVEDLISRATEELVTRAEREGKSLVQSGDAKAMLHCDSQWTAEALMNLIKNALDYTKPGGHIRVSWERLPGMFRITVADDGAGIAEEELPFLFKRFYRSKAAKDIQGVGLGLPLTKAVIEGQGGLISVRSAVGVGSTFTISFLTEP